MSLIPHEDAREESRRVSRQSGLQVAIVDAVHADSHVVRVTPITSTGDSVTDTAPVLAAVGVGRRGDVELPSVGDIVTVGMFQNQTPIVMQTHYSQENQVPSIDGADRVVSGEDGLALDAPYVIWPKRTDDPSTLIDGSTWYREDLDEYRGVENGSVVTFDTTAA